MLINKKYLILYTKVKNKNLTDELSFKKLYIKKPIYSALPGSTLIENNWAFQNIYNKYFCICKGPYCHYNICQKCKYLFYLNIIDHNKNIYEKTDYLLADFFSAQKSSDDAYPIFEEMIRLNINAHYMDQKKLIYNKFCKHENHCLKIIKDIFINGDFIEKYLDIILRLKAVICGTPFRSYYNIFRYIDYITYINVGHGVMYFKSFLYLDYISYKRYNKLVLPPSKKIVSLAKKYGWEDNNIIKICKPKWDKYDKYREEILLNNNAVIKSSIFILFTWRVFKNQISPYYIKNINNLLNNKKLNDVLIINNITLYFTLHHMLKNYENKIKRNQLIKFINQNQISDCLTKTNLLITDFSSVIFDMIYQRKPYIIFIPDIEDPTIKNNYKQGYYDIINGLKNGSLYFENKCLKLKEVIDKILYYVKNNFTIESNLSSFYDSFEFKCKKKNKTRNFINYLINNL